jgi:hypothetical protein
MEHLGGAEITDLTCFVDPTKGSLGFWVLGFRGCHPMGLPMFRPFCKGCKCINKKIL